MMETQQNSRGEGIEIIISEKRLNVIGTIFGIPVTVGALFLYPVVRGVREGSFTFGLGVVLQFLGFLLVYFALIAVHELLHGLGFKLLGRAKTKYSFDLRHMIALAAAQSPMSITAYRWSVILPTLVLALPLFLIGLATGGFPMYMMGALHIASGVGDFWILWALRGFPIDRIAMDHPTKPGCLVYPAGK